MCVTLWIAQQYFIDYLGHVSHSLEVFITCLGSAVLKLLGFTSSKPEFLFRGCLTKEIQFGLLNAFGLHLSILNSLL